MDEQSKEHGAAGRHLSVALSSEALYGKSQVYVQRALEAKDSKDQEVYQIWAALALELLAKASLAKIHPCLVVEVANPNSLLEACGIHTDTAVRTVDANIVFARLKHTVPNFGTPNAEACKKISARRNAELHSGQAAFASVPPEASEGEFWSAAQLILSAMGLTLDDWVGVASRTPMKLLRHLGMLKRKAARQRISDASQIFALNPEGKKRTKKELEILLDASKKLHWHDYREEFRYHLDHYWDKTCPACGGTGFLAGDRTGDEIIDQDYAAGYETVEQYYSPVEFYCPTCKLHLEGDEALSEGDLHHEHAEQSEREMEYEPDYGND
ncbi:hypothetical protein [Pseudomonas aeruginosa]|jgi:hypothetical protein